MPKEHQEELQLSIKPQQILKITARKLKSESKRICQGDIFENIEIIENISVEKDIIKLEKIEFPYIVCLNQECDLENDYNNSGEPKDSNLLHLAIAPAFIFDQYLTGTHWGQIFKQGSSQNRKDTVIKKIIDNEIPRYHYLKFNEAELPELIIDFKHFFSINRKVLYSQLNKRLCSLEELFKEKINQRFSYYISRIGLPT